MPERLHTDAPVLILDGRQRSALAVVRSLGRRGIRTLVASPTRRAIATSSRFAAESHLCPDPLAEPERFTSWLLETCAHHSRLVVLPMTDVTVPLVLAVREQLAGCLIPFPETSAYALASDKHELARAAERIGIGVPATHLATRANAHEVVQQTTSFPVVLKPRRSASTVAGQLMRRTVTYAYSQDELARILNDSLGDDEDEYLVQEFISGVGIGVFGLYEHGRPLAHFGHCRIREKPPTGGVSVLSESVSLPVHLREAVDRLMQSLRWTGVAMTELKRTAAGDFRLMEINGRFWGSLQLAIDCGVDFPLQLYRLATGQPIEPQSGYAVGRRMRWWLGDLDNLYLSLKDRRLTPTLGAAIGAVLRFLPPWQPRTRGELFRLNDPMPAVAAFREYVHELST